MGKGYNKIRVCYGRSADIENGGFKMLPDTLEELLDMELKNGLFDGNEHDDPFKTYTLDEFKKLIEDKFDRYINELKEKNRLKQHKKDQKSGTRK